MTKESKELIVMIIACVIVVLFAAGFIFGLYWMIGNTILKALGIIFNRQ